MFGDGDAANLNSWTPFVRPLTGPTGEAWTLEAWELVLMLRIFWGDLRILQVSDRGLIKGLGFSLGFGGVLSREASGAKLRSNTFEALRQIQPPAPPPNSAQREQLKHMLDAEQLDWAYF